LNGYLYWLMKEGLLTRYYQRNSPRRLYEYTITEKGFETLVRRRTIQELKKLIQEVKA
jgi:DNA-binding PadR family transcriptional regulator